MPGARVSGGVSIACRLPMSTHPVMIEACEHQAVLGLKLPMLKSRRRMRLQDRIAIVTGAQQGIGEAVARALSREGAAVVVNYLDDAARAEAIVAAIERDGGRACAVEADVSVPDDVEAMVSAAATLGAGISWSRMTTTLSGSQISSMPASTSVR